MSTSNKKYAIIGSGASGLHLAMAMKKNPNFDFDELLIFEKEKDNFPEKTWSFWEKGSGNWDNICLKKWNKTFFTAKGKTIQIDLNPFIYKSIAAKDFIYYCRKELSEDSRIKFIYDEVISLKENSTKVEVHLKENNFLVDFVFDSRLPSKKELESHPSKLVWQHFKGWFIETEKDCFDENVFTMMDYSIKDGDSTSFMYILPFSKRKALLEYTYFSPNIVEESVYDYYIKNYIANSLGDVSYTITSVEKGYIPMSNYPFEKLNSERIINIGTRGGWVKASSGYSFKHAEKKSSLIVQNLINDKTITQGIYKKKYQHYDSLFLEVLKNKNEFGEELFNRLYNKVPIEILLRFLDEETRFAEDLRIIVSLSSSEFIKAFFKHAKNAFNVYR